jgi:hypothetical protein
VLGSSDPVVVELVNGCLGKAISGTGDLEGEGAMEMRFGAK